MTKNLEFLLELGLLPLNSREEFAEWGRFHTVGRNPEVYLPTQMEIWDKLCPRPEVVDYVKQVLRQRTEHREVLQAAAYFKRMRTSYASSGRSFACQPFNICTKCRRNFYRTFCDFFAYAISWYEYCFHDSYLFSVSVYTLIK